MRIFDGEAYRDATPEEAERFEFSVAQYNAHEQTRLLTQEEVANMLIKEQINTLQVDDNTALQMREFYPAWEDLLGRTVDINFKFVHDGGLYKVIQPEHTFASQWVPGEGTESLYARIDEMHAGTQADPIPYAGNMELVEGLYYVQYDVLYHCTRGTGTPVYADLKDLTGIYVEVVQDV